MYDHAEARANETVWRLTSAEANGVVFFCRNWSSPFRSSRDTYAPVRPSILSKVLYFVLTVLYLSERREQLLLLSYKLLQLLWLLSSGSSALPFRPLKPFASSALLSGAIPGNASPESELTGFTAAY